MLAIRLAAFAAGVAVVPSCWAWQDRPRSACYDDVHRLCATAAPDVDAMWACLKTKRKLVRTQCAALLDRKR